MQSNPFQRPTKDLVEATQKDVIGKYRQETVAEKVIRAERLQKTIDNHITDEQLGDPTRLALLAGLSQLRVYGGTVDPATVAKRRAKNKAARKARRVHRLRSKS
jgi:hypothetical protein